MIGAASLAPGIGATAAMAGAGPGFAPMAGPGFGGPACPAGACTAPALAGAVVDVTVSDMGGMMGPRHEWRTHDGTGNDGAGDDGEGMNSGPMAGPQGAWPNSPGMGMGMMRLTINPTSVPAGQVSLASPTAACSPTRSWSCPGSGQNPGQRPIGNNWEVGQNRQPR